MAQTSHDRKFLSDWQTRNVRLVEQKELLGIIQRVQSIPAPKRPLRAKTLLTRATNELQRRATA